MKEKTVLDLSPSILRGYLMEITTEPTNQGGTLYLETRILIRPPITASKAKAAKTREAEERSEPEALTVFKTPTTREARQDPAAVERAVKAQHVFVTARPSFLGMLSGYYAAQRDLTGKGNISSFPRDFLMPSAFLPLEVQAIMATSH
jgi:hypothetical protein